MQLSGCPFCGGEAEFFHNAIDGVPVFGAQCSSCNVVPDSCCDTMDGAVAEWNTRDAPAQ